MTDILTPSAIAEMSELAEKATAGPWKSDGKQIYQTTHITRNVWMIPLVVSDAKFIAASRTFVPAAIATLRDLEQRLAAAEAVIETASDLIYCKDPHVEAHVHKWCGSCDQCKIDEAIHAWRKLRPEGEEKV